MSDQTSVSTRRQYGLQRVCCVWGVCRSTLYARSEEAPKRRGPQPQISDAELLKRVEDDLREALFNGEGIRL